MSVCVGNQDLSQVCCAVLHAVVARPRSLEIFLWGAALGEYEPVRIGQCNHARPTVTEFNQEV